jgi:hypothetical protein
MTEYKHLTRFPGKTKAVLESAAKKTGLSNNQLIVRCVETHLPIILAENEPLPAYVETAFRRARAVLDRELEKLAAEHSARKPVVTDKAAKR